MVGYIPLTFQLLLFDRRDDRPTASPFRTDFIGSRSMAFINPFIYVSLDFAEVYFHSRKKVYRCKERRRVFIRKFQLLARQRKIKAIVLICTTDLMDCKEKERKKNIGCDIIAREINRQSDYALTIF